MGGAGLGRRDTIERCKRAGAGEVVSLPVYDKSRHGGRGDRVERQHWPQVQGPVDLLILEGWMLGFRPLPQGSPLLHVDPGIPQVNDELAKYDAWHRAVEAWVVVQVEDVEWVYDWRREAEVKMREAKGEGAGMTDEQVKDFVSRYMPAYKAYLPGLYTHCPTISDGQRASMLRVRIGRDRSPI